MGALPGRKQVCIFESRFWFNGGVSFGSTFFKGCLKVGGGKKYINIII